MRMMIRKFQTKGTVHDQNKGPVTVSTVENIEISERRNPIKTASQTEGISKTPV